MIGPTTEPMAVQNVSGGSAKQPSRIFLIGYRGTGKTTVAKQLARRLGWNHVDADDEIEQLAGKSIREIFASQGEVAFRDYESRVVRELAERTDTVVALGGGAILRAENCQAIRSGLVIWLTADPQTIHDRVALDPSTGARRPNLTVAGGLAEIRELLAIREPLYRECADFTVDTLDKTPERIADEIVCFLQSRS